MRHYRRESLLILSRGDERTDHSVLFVDVTQWAAIHLAEPEHEAADIRVATQVSRVFRVHEGTIVFSINEGAIVDRIGTDVVVRQSVEHRSAAA